MIVDEKKDKLTQLASSAETKAKLEVALEKARSLHPLRQSREKLGMEMGNLPHNFVHLQMMGKTLLGERTRIEAETARIQQQERDLRQEVRDFFVSLVNASVPPVREKIQAALPKRQRLRALLAEASAIYCDLEQVQRDWKIEVDALKKVARELSHQTDAPGVSTIDSYINTIPEPPFVSPWVPAPTSQQVNRARNSGDNTAEILKSMANQIG